MLKTALHQAALLALSLLAISPAAAQDELKLVESVPAEVADVVTGGSWTTNGDGGFYRAFVVMSGEGDDFGARIYLQWLMIADDSPAPKVVKTLPVAEINEQGLDNASVEIDSEEGEDNRITLVVSSYDFENDKEVLLLVQAEEPGKYSMKEAPTAPPGEPEDD
jgi:hypothetical protein